MKHRESQHPPARSEAGPQHTLLVLLLGALAALVLTACSSDAAEQDGPPPAPPVSVAAVVARDIDTWDEFTGRVEAVATVEVRPRVTGYIHEVRFAEGREVRRNDVLFVIDPRPYRAALARAEAELARTRAQAELAASQSVRARRLVEARAISQEEHDQALAAESQLRAAVRAAEAAVESARLDLEFTEVRAPIAGRAGRALVTAGNFVAAGGVPLTTIVSLDPVFVYFESDEQTYLRSADLARRGATNRVRVGLAHEDGYPHEGRLDFVDNQVNPQTGTIRSRAVLSNADRTFTPGLFARVQLQASATQAAILIDEKAVLTDQDRKFVYVLGAGNRAERRDVTLGRRVDGLRVVDTGLAAGDSVIVHGVQRVFFPGMTVQPTQIAMGDPPPAAPGSGLPAPAPAGDDHAAAATTREPS